MKGISCSLEGEEGTRTRQMELMLEQRGKQHAASSGAHLLDGILAAAEAVPAILVHHREARRGCCWEQGQHGITQLVS
jgi:hypothetical protein